jgi:uncharacterized protein (TIGR00645 family)
MEKFAERMFFASRWLLAPIYFGLSVALIILGIQFFLELFHAFQHVLGVSPEALEAVADAAKAAQEGTEYKPTNSKEAEIVLALLALVDLSLVAGLIVMVMFSGYENFVSKMDIDESGADKLGWLGKLDASTLKMKVAASIVAISSIHLLRKFMEAEGIENDKLLWYVIIHMTFVFSAVLMGVLDRMTAAGHRSKADH